MSAPLLQLSHLRKSFGATQALSDASLGLNAGEVTALIGENGAGKSTLVKILAGFHQPEAGEIVIAGTPVRITDASHARRLGISVVHQECVVFDNLSVAENIFLGQPPRRRGLIAWKQMRQRAAAVLGQLDAAFDPDLPAGRLSIAQKHIVQIARALTDDARVLILDEPTAALSHHEVDDLFRITRSLAQTGCAVLLISHRFEEVFAIADRFAVFRDGVTVGEGLIRDTDSARLIQMMVGRPVGQLFPKLPTTIGDELLRVERLSRTPEFDDISFSVRRGEILGVYGLVGAGRSELARCLFGLEPVDSGTLHIGGKAVTLSGPQDAIAHGLAYVPEDRQAQGVITPFSIAANIALPNLDRLERTGIVSSSRETQLAQHWIAALSVKARGPGQAVTDLSGGNQQKVAIAKWLARDPQLLILDEPTKGIDVGAKAAVHAITSEFAQRGNAVLMISSDLPEIMGMSDRILVMRRGRARGLFDRAQATAESIVRAATDA
ncbi:MAG TPA: sugar ABC transporter ATP-binding protein [Povalibacter sp.]|nr:sugar ABC transporter ATP-binding protein [Povalibacter sp.]